MKLIVEGKWRRGSNTSINLLKDQRINYTGVQGFRVPQDPHAMAAQIQ